MSATGVDVHRFPSGGVVHLVAELAARLGAAVVLPDGVLVGDEEQRANLPDGLREAAVVIEMTGSACGARSTAEDGDRPVRRGPGARSRGGGGNGSP